MIEGYLSIKEKAEKWGITSQRFQVLCPTGKIKGGVKLGHEWVFSINVVRPMDKCVTMGRV